MRSRVGLALALALALLHSMPLAVRADCCGTADIETYQVKVSTCKDCSEPNPWCGEGPCNWFGECRGDNSACGTRHRLRS